MQTRWLKENVNLNQLSDFAKQFFEEIGFEITTQEESKNTIKLSAKTRTIAPAEVMVEIRGKPEDFTIVFKPKSGARNIRFLGPILSSLGLGVVTKYELNVSEFYEKLENEFWTLEEKISNASNRNDH
jgi:hypothetical protein